MQKLKFVFTNYVIAQYLNASLQVCLLAMSSLDPAQRNVVALSWVRYMHT